MTDVRRGPRYRWVHDRCTIGTRARYRLRRIVLQTRTRYQEVGIYDLHRFGRALFLDGVLQSAQADEHRYHEALVHPALLTHPHPRRVLIAGGGEGATLRETLRHACVEAVLMAELDGELVDLCRKYMPKWADGAFDDPRSAVAFGDARKLIERNRSAFDVCICDLTEPSENGGSVMLFTREFFQSARRCLRRPGMLVTQAGSIAPQSCGMFLTIRDTLRQVFKHVHAFRARIPSFREPWGFICASDQLDPTTGGRAKLEKLVRDRGLGRLRYYTPAAHARVFRLPGGLPSHIHTVSFDAKPFTMA